MVRTEVHHLSLMVVVGPASHHHPPLDDAFVSWFIYLLFMCIYLRKLSPIVIPLFVANLSSHTRGLHVISHILFNPNGCVRE